jgi:hypothetical protein
MSLYQFCAAVDGWNKAQGGEDAIAPPTAEEFLEAKRLHGDA